MNVRKKAPLFLGGGILAVLLVLVIVALIHFHKNYNKVDRDLQSGLQRLSSLNQQNPYPSEENVKLAEERLARLQGYFNDLMRSLREDQIESDEVQPDEFLRMLEKALGKLRSEAKAAEVELPDGFGFGFSRYVQGALPKDEHIPRLVIELKAVEELGKLLFESKIARLGDVRRDSFDKAKDLSATPTRSRGRGRGAAPQPAPQLTTLGGEEVEHELYSVEHFTLEFEARESAVWDVLNRLAESQLFIVISSIELQGQKTELTRPTDNEKKDAEDGKRRFRSMAEARSSRVVAGEENVTVKLNLSMYRFKTVS